MFDAQEFFDRYTEFEPEEACTLGAPGDSGRLRDASLEGQERRISFFRATRDALSEKVGSIDADVVARHADWEIFAHDNGLFLRNAAWAMYPYTMLRYEIASRVPSSAELEDPQGPYQRRAAAVEGFLREHQACLLEGRENGHLNHRHHYQCLVEFELPNAASFFASLNEKAGAAIEDHVQFITRELLPRAPEHVRLGEDLYGRGLSITHGLTRPLAELVAEAQADLDLTQAEMIRVASKLYPQRSFAGFNDVCELLNELQSQTLAGEESVEAFYRDIISRVSDHMAEAGEFHAIDAEAMGMSEYPEGMRDAGPGTNWPAPLLDDSGRGQFVIHPDPAAHSRPWAPVLAVHEGIPGHYLQSIGFRKAFGSSSAPVRFLCVADDVAIPRGNFVSMLNIEGYAVYAEECVRLAGFHQGQAELFALCANALRCVRVIAEIDFHRGERSAEETAEFVTSQTGLPSAKWELERYQRGPFQAPSYYFGAKAFQKLRRLAEKQLGNQFSAADFHERLFSFGPVLPGTMEAHMFA